MREEAISLRNLTEKTKKSEPIYKGKIISLQLDEVELPNGNTSYREIVRHPGAVAVIAITEENKILMVRQFRKALDKTIYEIPAGKRDLGEEPELTAKRELEEETGYIANKWSHLVSFYTSPGFADEYLHLYIAEELSYGGELQLDEDEFVELFAFTLEECKELIQEGDICDAKTVAAIYHWELQQLRASK